MTAMEQFRIDYKEYKITNLKKDPLPIDYIIREFNDNARKFLNGGCNSKEDPNIRIGKLIIKDLKQYFYSF